MAISVNGGLVQANGSWVETPAMPHLLQILDEQNNPVTQSQVMADPKYAAQVMLREQACQAFLEEHAQEAWRRAIAGRNRPMCGPYVPGQLVYMFRRRGRGQLSTSTRHGVWLGPGRIVASESSTNGVIPRLISGFIQWLSLQVLTRRSSTNARRWAQVSRAHQRAVSWPNASGHWTSLSIHSPQKWPVSWTL